jgi:hypothetical protein
MKNTLRLIIIAIAFFVIIACLNSVTIVSGFVAVSCDKVVKTAMASLNTRLAENVNNLYRFAPVDVHRKTIITSLNQIKLFLNTSNNSISLSNNSCRSKFNEAVSKININANIATIEPLVNGRLPLNATNMSVYKTNITTIKGKLGVDQANKFKFNF